MKFLSNLNVKPPLHKRKAPLLMIFWRVFWCNVAHFSGSKRVSSV